MDVKQYDWYISDTHWGHRNIIDYCGRPSNADGLMFTKWVERVGPNDTVLHLGDFAMPDWRVDVHGWWADLFARLTGKITLIPGNHDHKKHRAHMKRHGVTIGEPFVYQGVLWSHKPLTTDLFNVHGHIHNNKYPSGVDYARGKHRNISVEVTGYAPVRWSEIEAGLVGNTPEEVGVYRKSDDPERNH